MSSVDERVVQMKFDNKQFENGVKTTINSIDKLKNSLNFKGSVKNIQNLQKEADSFNLHKLANAADGLNQKFSALGLIGMNTFMKLADAATQAGLQISRAIKLQPIIDGFHEYETQIGAIQTILANTQGKGSTLQDVNTALDTLNHYADKTIYNFTEMTRNIGTFTAAGVDLQTSVDSIQGIANLAAVSGSTSLQASTAMYQLSQAIATGTVRLMDWNSVVNAGMGGQVFQDALIRTSEHLQTGAKAAIEAKGSFRDSLQEGWLTTQVLTETLNQFALCVDTAEDYEATIKGLVDSGYTQEEAEQIAKMAKTATEAATKVKTFSMLLDTLKEALGSGWTESFEIIIGDFEEARSMWTNVSDTLSNMINESANARNQLLTSALSSGWKQLLSAGIQDEQAYIASVKEVASERGIAVDEFIEQDGSFQNSLKRGWLTSDILSESITKLADKTRGLSIEELRAMGYSQDQIKSLEELEAGVKDGSVSLQDFSDKFTQLSGREQVIAGLANVFDTIYPIITKVKEGFREIFPSITAQQIYDATTKFKQLTEQLKPTEEFLNNIYRISRGVSSGLDLIKQAVVGLLSPLTKLVGSGGLSGIFNSFINMLADLGDALYAIREGSSVAEAFSHIGSKISSMFENVLNIINELISKFSDLDGIVNTIGSAILNVFSKIRELLSSVANWAKENLSIWDVFTGISIALAAPEIKNLIELLTKLKVYKDMIFNLLGIGGGKSSGGDEGEGDEKGGGIFGSLFGGVFDNIGALIESVSELLGSLSNALNSFSSSVRIASLIMIAGSVAILTKSLKTLSELNIVQTLQGISAIGGLVKILVVAMGELIAITAKAKPTELISMGIALKLVASALNSMAKATKTLGDLNFGELVKGLAGVMAIMYSMSKFINKTDMGKGASVKNILSLIAVAEAVKIMADGMAKFSGMSWEDLLKGIIGMGSALTALSISMKILDGVKVSLGTTVAIAAMALVADSLANTMKNIASMSWDEVKRGVIGLAAALGEIVAVMLVMNKLKGFKSVLSAVSIFVITKALDEIVDALQGIGSMDKDSIVRGLTGLGAALAEMVVVMEALNLLGPFKSIISGVALNVCVKALDEIVDALQGIGSMDKDSIVRGLTGLGAALAEMVVVMEALNLLDPFKSIISGVALNVCVKALDELAEAFTKFASIGDWDRTKQALVGMGGALAEVGIVAGLLGNLSPIAGLVGAGTLDLAVQGLDKLAEGFLKFASVDDWDKVKMGLVSMGGALAEIGAASFLTGLGGLASFIGAGSLDVVVQGLDKLAEAFIKFGSMDKESILQATGAMGYALSEAGLGALLSTFSGAGAATISAMAEPLGTLADSVKKWEGVNVPENLSNQLSGLADGVGYFTWTGFGADSISTVAEPLGTLADSVKKWEDVNVPDDIGDRLGKLADGVNKFFWSGTSSGAIKDIAEPLGTLADSVKKWEDVNVPDTLGDNLGKLAEGANKFAWSGQGAGALKTVAEGLDPLADAMDKWGSVHFRTGIQDFLTEIANGVNAFSVSAVGAVQIALVPDPLKNLADAMEHFGSIEWPSGVYNKLSNLAEGIKCFGETTASGITQMKDSKEGFENIANGVATLNGVSFDTAGTNLTNFATVISNIPTTINNAVTSVGDSFTNLTTAIAVQGGSLTSAFSTLMQSALNTVESQAGSFSTAGMNVVMALSNAVTSAIQVQGSSVQTTLVSSCMLISNSGVSELNNSIPRFNAAGKSMMDGLKSGLSNGLISVVNVCRSIGSACANAVKGDYGEFYNAGLNMMRGLQNGINDGRSGVINSAISAASDALRATKEALDEHSPSKATYKMGRYYDEGLINGMESMREKIRMVSSDIGYEALNGMQENANKMNFSNLSSTATITPVINGNDYNLLTGLNASKSVMLNAKFANMQVVDPINSLRDSMIKDNMEVIKSNNQVLDSINGLREDMSAYNDSISNMENAMYIDGKKMASSIAKPMNRELGILTKRGRLS